jgi:hypothetical protein
MYSERDMLEIDGRIRRAWLELIPVLVVIAAALVFALVRRIHWLALVAAPLLIVAFMYGFIARLWPNLRYRRFLRDMENGLSRDLQGVVVAIADVPELHDGAMVLPVRIQAEADVPTGTSALSERIQQLEAGEDTREERIVYLNVAKRDAMPAPGTPVTLHCFGRHIKGVEAR